MTGVSFPPVEAARGCGALRAMPVQAVAKVGSRQAWNKQLPASHLFCRPASDVLDSLKHMPEPACQGLVSSLH